MSENTQTQLPVGNTPLDELYRQLEQADTLEAWLDVIGRIYELTGRPA